MTLDEIEARLRLDEEFEHRGTPEGVWFGGVELFRVANLHDGPSEQIMCLGPMDGYSVVMPLGSMTFGAFSRAVAQWFMVARHWTPTRRYIPLAALMDWGPIAAGVRPIDAQRDRWMSWVRAPDVEAPA